MKGPRLVFAACETFAPELGAALAKARVRGVEWRTFECRCSLAPLAWEDLPDEEALADDAELHVFGSSCLRRVAADRATRPGVVLHRLATCQELIAPRATLDALVARGGYLITLGWLRTWERRFEALGLTSQEARGMIGEACRGVVLLDSGVEEHDAKQLDALTRAVGLPAEIVPIGNEVLERRLEVLALEWELARARAAASRVSRAMQPAADYAMALDVFGRLAGAGTESDLVEGLFELFDTLMAPRAMCYVPVVEGRAGTPIRSNAASAAELGELPVDGPYALDGDGFSVDIPSGRSRAGVLHVRGLAYPESRERYLAFTLNVASVCGIAIEKARQYEQLVAAQRALSGEKERLATTLRSIGDGVVATDRSGNLVLMNDVAERLTGCSQRSALGKPWTQILRIFLGDGGTIEDTLVARVLARGELVQRSSGVQLVSADGTTRAIAHSAAPILDQASREITGVVIVFRDITHAELLEKELSRIARLESLGVFASGLAHDFNNLLAAQLGNLSIVREDTEDGSSQAECLDEAIRATERARALTQQLMTFARGGVPVKVKTSILSVLEDSVSLPLHGTNTRAEIDAKEGLWDADADPGQLGQVVQNLVINASQAMPRGGVVRIECHNVEASEVARLPLAPRRYVRISVVDQGPGIASENVARIFDPFFTTKSSGNGLGLAVVHSIVRRHDGHVEVRSPPGAGAQFHVYLPAAAASRAPHAPAEATPSAARSVEGTGRILLMDDDVALRTVTERMLVRLGYTVTSVSDSEAAVQAYQAALAADTRFDLVILDLTIPGGKGGVETLELLLALDSTVRAVAATGYSNAPVVAERGKYGFVGALSKPFSMLELSQMVNAQLLH